jgi:hypothetical protein
VSELGRRIIIKTLPQGTSAGFFGSDRARTPTQTLMRRHLELVDHQRHFPILAAG